MIRRALFLIPLAFVVTAAISSKPSFRRDLAPVLEQRCAACHLTGTEPGKLSLGVGTSYQNLVNQRSVQSPLLRVKPGDPDSSYLVRKLDGTHLAAHGKGARMPLGAAPIGQQDLRTLRRWIAAGAPNN